MVWLLELCQHGVKQESWGKLPNPTVHCPNILNLSWSLGAIMLGHWNSSCCGTYGWDSRNFSRMGTLSRVGTQFAHSQGFPKVFFLKTSIAAWFASLKISHEAVKLDYLHAAAGSFIIYWCKNAWSRGEKASFVLYSLSSFSLRAESGRLTLKLCYQVGYSGIFLAMILSWKCSCSLSVRHGLIKTLNQFLYDSLQLASFIAVVSKLRLFCTPGIKMTAPTYVFKPLPINVLSEKIK